MSLKEKLMNQMMDKQFGNMNSEEKQQMMETMMDKFFSGMSDNDKKEIMGKMMPKMMEQMMGSTGGNPMMGMMQMMMGSKRKPGEKTGNKEMPWDRCMDMMNSFKETAHSARFATPELRTIFDEWCEQIENELMELIKKEKKVNTKILSDKLNLSVESIRFLLTKLTAKELIEYRIE